MTVFHEPAKQMTPHQWQDWYFEHKDLCFCGPCMVRPGDTVQVTLLEIGMQYFIDIVDDPQYSTYWATLSEPEPVLA